MPASKYKTYTPEFVTSTHVHDTTQPVVHSVQEAISGINATGNFMSVWDGQLFPDKRYTSSTANSGKDNHFQGFRRLQNSNYLLMSGSDKGTKSGHVFVAHLPTRSEESAWRSNVLYDNKPPADDKVILTLCVNDSTHGLTNEFWHVGGLASLGDVVAAPVESTNDGSVILFYSFTDPQQPRLFDKNMRISRPDSQAGAVTMAMLPNGHMLVLVLGKHKADDKLRLDLYLSNDQDITQGFTLTDSWLTSPEFPDCQGMDLVIEDTGKLYIVTLYNTKKLAPIAHGDDLAELFEIQLNHDDLTAITAPTCSVRNITPVSKKQFVGIVKGRGKTKYSPFQCNMNAGAGLYIHPAGSLFMYSCFHWRRYNRIAFAEFHPDPEHFTPDHITSLDQSWVDMYENDMNKPDTDRGLHLSLGGNTDMQIADFSKLTVQGKSFNKAVSSIRYQIPAGQTLRLFRHKRFESKNNDHLDLVGNGKLQVIKDLKKVRDFGDKVQSCKYV